MSTTPCVQCGAQHDPGASPCPEPSLVGRTLRAGIRVRELLGDTPVGPHYRAEYPTGLEVAVNTGPPMETLVVGSVAREVVGCFGASK